MHTQTSTPCPVMQFCVNQAQGILGLEQLPGKPGRVHQSPFHDDSEPAPGMDEMLARVFGTEPAL